MTVQKWARDALEMRKRLEDKWMDGWIDSYQPVGITFLFGHLNWVGVMLQWWPDNNLVYMFPVSLSRVQSPRHHYWKVCSPAHLRLYLPQIRLLQQVILQKSPHLVTAEESIFGSILGVLFDECTSQLESTLSGARSHKLQSNPVCR